MLQWALCLSAPTGVGFPITLLADYKSSILIANSEGLLRRIKHIEIQDLYVRSAWEKGIVNIEFVPGESNIADIMTKSVCSVGRYFDDVAFINDDVSTTPAENQ